MQFKTWCTTQTIRNKTFSFERKNRVYCEQLKIYFKNSLFFDLQVIHAAKLEAEKKRIVEYCLLHRV